MSRRTALAGMLAAVSIILGYVETLIPISIGIPGVKLGLANIVIVSVLYLYDLRTAALVSFIRILVVGFLFTNLYSILYSLSGAVLSLIVMALLRKSHLFTVCGVSIAGGVCHNLGQLLMAAFVVSTPAVLGYFPVLLIAGTITGMGIGVLSSVLQKRLNKAMETDIS